MWIRQAMERLTRRRRGDLIGLTVRQVRRLIQRVPARGDRGWRIGDGEAVRPADREGQGRGACAVRDTVWRFWADAGGREAGRAPWDRAQRRDAGGSFRGGGSFSASEAPASGVAGAEGACGELVQLDGSHHDWLEGRGPACVLMAYIDDASSRVLARF